jgi:hypothetical protein
MEEELGNRDNNPNNPVVILRFAILASSSDSADRGRSIIRVTETTSFDCHWKNMAIEIGRRWRLSVYNTEESLGLDYIILYRDC